MDTELQNNINSGLDKMKMNADKGGNLFDKNFMPHGEAILNLYNQLYKQHPQSQHFFEQLIVTMATAFAQRPEALKKSDEAKALKGNWFLSNHITGMSLYVDRFCGNLNTLAQKLEYFNTLGVNLLHLMPVMQSPAGESDGGYAVSDFRKVDERFGTTADLIALQQKIQDKEMYLMMDIVMNHTSHLHEWAQKAKAGEKKYQDFFYMYDDRQVPDQFESAMPEVFPGAAPGNFTYVSDCNKWVMTVFHNYQWDLNFTNPEVFIAMLENVFYYANLGVDILRIDAPAFIWKQLGTGCQNLPQAHTLLRLLKQCVQVATPGMALLAEAIVAPKEIMKYFGNDDYTAQECDLAYNATHMALQWDALATGNTKVMLAAQHEILQKPFGTSWINYTRCHDDIGLGYDDYMIKAAGYDPYEHRKFLKNYYAGLIEGSVARGALFGVNTKTEDARISGSLASLCGLEKAIEDNDAAAINTAINKILLMQAHSFFMGGIPMIFYGDEAGYTNDYSYLKDEGKNYDNRWMHRPLIDWEKNKKITVPGTPEQKVFAGTQQLISLRKKLTVISDQKNITWLQPHNHQVAGYLRKQDHKKLYGVFNFSNAPAPLTWFAFKQHGPSSAKLYDHWREKFYNLGYDNEYLILKPYSFYLLEQQ